MNRFEIWGVVAVGGFIGAAILNLSFGGAIDWQSLVDVISGAAVGLYLHFLASEGRS